MPTSRPLEGVVVAFDLDGTLVDTAPDLIGALNQTLAREGLPSLPVSSARHLVGRGAPYLIEHGFAEAGRPLDPMRIDALEEAVVADYRSRITAESRPFPGCEAALDALIAEGAVLAVCTNKRTSLALPLLDGLDLTRRFAAICGGDLVAAGKPDPALLHLTIDRAGGRSDRAVMVGDAGTDTGAARAAGVPCVVVDWGYTEIPPAELGGDVVISRFADLPAAARALLTVASPAAIR
jgi:phosphoglycolate phosphatase